MPKVTAYLDCGCAILEGGGRVRCPTHDWELEKQLGESRQPYPSPEEIQREIAWEREMEEKAEEDMDRADRDREQAWDIGWDERA